MVSQNIVLRTPVHLTLLIKRQDHAELLFIPLKGCLLRFSISLLHLEVRFVLHPFGCLVGRNYTYRLCRRV